MKQFMYFQSREGGMDVNEFSSASEFPHLYGWMSGSWIAEDSAMLSWMDVADIGETYYHRLGVLVRV